MIMAENETLLSVRALRKSYFSSDIESKVLHGINLDLGRGEFAAIMGYSGSGKSTLMNILGCLDKASSGEHYFEGVDIAQLSHAQLADIRNRKLGFVFQSFNLIKRMSAEENVALPLIYAGIPRKQALYRAREELAKLGLAPLGGRMPNQLSGGQQQRVAVARALITRPTLLLADEPTGNLDTQTSLDVMALLRNLNGELGLSILLVTHEPDIAAYAPRLIRVTDGMITYDGLTGTGLQANPSKD